MCLAACGEARLSSLIGRCWSKGASLAHEPTKAIKEAVDAVHLAHRTAHELPPFARRGLPQLRACSSCACDDDARSFPRFNMTGVTVTSMMRHCGELIRIAMVYLCYTDIFYIR